MAPYTRFAGNPGFICFEFAGNRVIALFKFAGNPEIVCFEFAGKIKIALFCGIDSIVTLWIRRYSNGKFTTVNTNNLAKVDAVKRRIIKLYSDDFLKIDPTGKLSKLFITIPAQLSKKATRFYANAVVGELGKSTEEELLINLEDSKAVLVSYHADDPNVGMSLTQDLSKYKLFVADTDLFVTMVFWDKDFTENVIYQKLLTDKLEANLGYVYENLVAQMLTAAGNKLFYYTFEKDEKHAYEVDFLLSRGNKICPIEVKSSGYKTHASLDAFRAKYTARIKNSYLLYTKDLQIGENELMYLPFYMTGMI